MKQSIIILIILILIGILYYNNIETFNNPISIVRNRNIISIFFENSNKQDQCKISLFQIHKDKIKPDTLIKEISLDLDKNTIFNKHDIILDELDALHNISELKILIKLGSDEKDVTFKIDDVLKKSTEDIMCHGDGSIGYGYCDEEDIVPHYRDFFTEENKQKRAILLDKLKQFKTHKIVIK